MLLVTIEAKDIAIKYTHNKKMIIFPMTKPIPSNAFKAHMLSLEIRKV